ncbi:S4 RNA-binding domain-containing protein [Chloropicon primus]|nr:S4 RNA-binding domain-containing protein [Chloropicon primus]
MRLVTKASSRGGKSRKDLVLKFAGRAERAAERYQTSVTPFLPLATWRDLEQYFKRRADVACVATGGYEEAERRLVVLGRPELVQAKTGVELGGEGETRWEEDYVACLSINGNFKFDEKKRSHRHVLGSILGCGIGREVVGDVLVPPQGSSVDETDLTIHAIVSADMSDFLEHSLTRIGRVPVKSTRVPLSEVVNLPSSNSGSEDNAVMRTCSSSRIDAVASASFKISRSKVVEAVKKGEIQLNWEPCTKPGTVVSKGDVITFRGRGRSRILSLEVNRRDRTVVEFCLFT